MIHFDRCITDQIIKIWVWGGRVLSVSLAQILNGSDVVYSRVSH